MKKFIAILCSLLLMSSLFVGCTKEDGTKETKKTCDICGAEDVTLSEMELENETINICDECKEHVIEPPDEMAECASCGEKKTVFMTEVPEEGEDYNCTVWMCYDCLKEYKKTGEFISFMPNFDEEEELYDEYEEDSSGGMKLYSVNGNGKKGKYIKPYIEKTGPNEYLLHAGYYENDQSKYKYSDEYTLAVSYEGIPTHSWDLGDGSERQEILQGCRLYVYKEYDGSRYKIGAGGPSLERKTGSFDVSLELYPGETCKISILPISIALGDVKCTGVKIK